MTNPVGPRLLTIFDEPVRPLRAPGALTSGVDPALQVVDGFVRGGAVIGRAGTGEALVGIKVRIPEGASAIRVAVGLAMDNASLSWWDERVPEEVHPRTPGGARLIEILSQGERRAVTMLQRRSSDHGANTRAFVEFELPAEQVDPDGLLVIELRSMDADRVASEHVIAPYGVVGVRLDSIEVLPKLEPAAPDSGHLAVGHQPARAANEVALRTDFFVANPGRVSTPVWTLRAVPEQPAGPSAARSPQVRSGAEPGTRSTLLSRRGIKKAAKKILPRQAWPTARRAVGLERQITAAVGHRRRSGGQPTAGSTAVRQVPTVPAEPLPIPVPAEEQVRGLATLLSQLVEADRIRVRAWSVDEAAGVDVTVTTGGDDTLQVRPVDPVDRALIVSLEVDERAVAAEPTLRGRLGWQLLLTDRA